MPIFENSWGRGVRITTEEYQVKSHARRSGSLAYWEKWQWRYFKECCRTVGGLEDRWRTVGGVRCPCNRGAHSGGEAAPRIKLRVPSC